MKSEGLAIVGIVVIIVGVVMSLVTYESVSFSFMIIGFIGAALLIMSLLWMLLDAWRK